MGKLITFVSILVFIDILFLMTGQLGFTSPTSVVLGAILNLSGFKASLFFVLFLGIIGIGGLAATSGVTSGTLVNATNILAFTAMAIAMGALVGDYLAIFVYLKSINEVLATVFIAPILMIFVVVIAEWLRGKD